LLFYENSLPPPLTKGLNETTSGSSNGGGGGSSSSSSSYRRSLMADERERERERGDFVKNERVVS
jgi:hypothetical protein